MEDHELIMQRETIEIEGNRKLYDYTFRTVTPADRLIAIVESQQVGVIGPFLERHPELDLGPALELARTLGNREAIAEIETHRDASGPSRPPDGNLGTSDGG